MGLLVGVRRCLLDADRKTYHVDKVLGYDPIAYWMLAEGSSTVAVCQVNPAQNGTYNSDVSTWPTGTGIGDGNTAPIFDGANDFINIYTATFAGVFNGAEGSLVVWLKVSGAGVWTDATERYVIDLRADADNRVHIVKPVANDQLDLTYQSGGAIKVHNASITSTDWIVAAITWSAAGDEVAAYIAGIPVEVFDTLGAWAGALDSDLTVIGDIRSTAPLRSWSGPEAHVAVFGSALSGTAIADLSTVCGG